MLIDRAEIQRVLPGYQIGGQIGRGGFGLVFTARHRRLDVTRAVKVIVTGEADGLEVSRRFLAEAQVMTELDHPHLVRVFEYAEDGALHLLVMEYLAGGTLTQRLRTTVDPREACAWALALADGLQAVHDRGVAHRDIKPDNVLFTAAGAPKLADFGIAKVMEGTARPTSGLLGTPLYMAPEQFLGAPVGPRTDIYSLGATVYRALSGRAPFAPDLSLAAIVRHQLEVPPAPLDDAPPRIARVVFRSLAKKPADRPASARGFAVELARAAREDFGSGWIAASGVPLRVDSAVLLDEPAPILPNPAAETVSVGVPVFGDSALAEPVTQPVRPAGGPRRRVWKQAIVAGAAVLVLVPASAYAGAQLTDREAPVNPPVTATADPEPTSVASTITLEHELKGHTDTIYSVVYDPIRNRLVSGGKDRTIRFWDVETGKQIGPAHPSGHGIVNGLTISEDGRILASAGDDHSIQLWDPVTGAKRGQPLTGHTDAVNAIASTRDGRVLASAGHDHTVRLWDTTSGRQLGAPLTGHTQGVTWVAISPNGKTVASVGNDRTLRLWDVAAHAPIGAPLTGHAKEIWTVAFSQDGSLVATGSEEGTVRLWDVAGHRQLGAPLEGHTDTVDAVAFSPDGTLLASAGTDTSLGLWNPRTGAPISMLATDHERTTYAMTFSPDSRRVITAGADRTIRIWRLS